MYHKAKAVSFCLVSVLLLSVIGCGGGGGGGNPAAPVNDNTIQGSTPAAGTSVLTTRGNIVHYEVKTGSITFELPTPGKNECFGLVLTNIGSIRSIVIQPLTNVAASTLSAPTANIHHSMPERRRPVNQHWAEQEIRNQFYSISPPRTNALSMINASSIDEVEGDEVIFNLYSKDRFSSGNLYTQRTAVLKKIGAHCKIFVEKDDWQGLNANTGPSAVSDEELNHLVNEFDNVAWPLMSAGYGMPFDIDGDGHVTIVISAMYTQLGFAGLFDSKHLTLVDGSNRRDMIAIFAPDPTGITGETWDRDEWLIAGRETLVHELQHLINYSYKPTTDFATQARRSEVAWLDESLSVGSEARYRIRRGDSAGEDRFNKWGLRPAGYSLTDFSRDVAKYGLVGMFGHYMYEQGGADAIKNIVQSNEYFGADNINNVFAGRGGLRGIYRDFGVAALTEGLRKQQLAPLALIDSKYKYDSNLDFSMNYVDLPFGTKATISLSAYTTDFYYMTPPQGYNNATFKFVVYSPAPSGTDDLICTLVRY